MNDGKTSGAIRVEPRYYRLHADLGAERAEEEFTHRTLKWHLPLSEAALICVDVWNVCGIRGTRERTDDITRQKIAPVLAACRQAGLGVIHAPAGPVAQKHRNWVRLLDEHAKPAPAFPDSPDWPPTDFRDKTGDYAHYARPHEPQEQQNVRSRNEDRDFHPAAMPADDEPVVLTGEELHRLCARRGILHLFYVGFHTNMCVMMRDYGIPEMTRRGYHAVLLRDCTTGIESFDTREDMICTRGTIAEVEQCWGYTISSAELIEALK